MSSVVRPLPHLELPVAYVRLWPGERSADPGLDLTTAVEPFEGVVRLGDGLLVAVMPVAGRASVVDAAVRLARLLLEGSAPDLRALVYPGRLRRGPAEVDPVRDTFAVDLETQRPPLPVGSEDDVNSRLVLTGYAAARVKGRLAFDPVGIYDPPSGRRVPLSTPVGRTERPNPTHDAEILGKRAHVPRPALEGELEALLDEPVFQVVGPLGVGKSHLVWHRLSREIDMADWLVAGPDRLAAPPLAESLAERFGLEAGESEENDPFREASRLLAAAPTDARLVLDVTAASWRDRELVEALAEQARDEAEGSRWILLQREAAAGWDDLPTLRVPPLAEDEMETLADKLCAGLDFSDAMRRRYLDAAAGHPLALGQCLIRLLHRGLLRQVYGSYFYAGDAEAEVEASEQLVSEVEAEARRLGDPLPLRLLAAVGEPIASHHLQQACDRFGIELDNDWHEPLRAAGLLDWVDGSADRLAFTCPAYALALRQTAPADAGRTLRHALGGVLADENAGWRAYRLLAGTPEAVPSLLDVSRDGAMADEPSSGAATREELFNALWDEHREHRERGGDPTTELEILWNLLPLAHRLGTLGRLRDELERAVALAVATGRGSHRHVALAALLAELDQEQGRYREAEEALRQALGASQGLDETKRASLFVRLGTLLSREERWSEARAVFGQLLEIARAAKSKSLEATCRYHLGHVALMERRHDEAKEEHRKAAELRREMGQEKAYASSLVALGQVALAEGDAHTALATFDRSLEHLEAAGAQDWERGGAWVGRARALERLGELSQAVRSLRRALEVRRSADTAGEALARLTLGEIFLQEGKTDDAEAEARNVHFQASLLSDASLLGDAERLLGLCVSRDETPDQAFAHFYEALAQHGRHEDAEALARDRACLVELCLRHDDADGVFLHSAELRTLLDDLRSPRHGEVLHFRLYRGLSWLRERGIAVPDPVVYLRAAYQDLMRKTAFLPADRRHVFLYQVRDHQDLLEAAAQHDLSLPVFTV